MDENINRVNNPIQWLLNNVPGGDVAIVVIAVVGVISMAVLVTRGTAWGGPLAIVGAIGMIGFLNAVGIASAPVMVIIMALAALVGVAMMRAARAR